MFTINTIKNNLLNNVLHNELANAANAPLTDQVWLRLASVESHQELSSHYVTICQQYNQDKKWLLFINPEESSLEQLAQSHGVDVSKVLCVSFKGKNKTNNLLDVKSAHLDIEHIKNVLRRGNCSAVILSNASFDADEIIALNHCARLGETRCVLLKNTRKNQLLVTNAKIH